MYFFLTDNCIHSTDPLCMILKQGNLNESLSPCSSLSQSPVAEKYNLLPVTIMQSFTSG